MTRTGAPRPARGSWWLEEALAFPAFEGPEAPPLYRDTGADVVILGGGYTGMWTAWFLKEREPALDVVLLERDVCGGGPSGRNGGFVNGLYDEADVLIDRHGEAGRRTVAMAARSIDEIGRWCEDAGVDAWYERSGNLGVSTGPAHDASVSSTVAEAERFGLGDVYRPLSTEEIRERFDSPVVRTGFEVAHAATVHPARLARGLRNALLERGVRIFEGTPVVRFNARRPTAETPGGTVRAGRAVVGLNAWARAMREFRRSLLVRGTFIVISAPAPECLEAMRWTGGEGVYDLRTSLHYLRPTRDGRIAFGGSSFRVSGDRADSSRYGYDERSASALARDFRRWFPTFDGVPLETAWGGPIDVAGLHLPFFGTLPGGVTSYGLGFTGNGVGPCHLGGKILSGLALGLEDEATTLPIADGDRMRFPPEPWFTLGERLISRAIVRRDGRLDAGRIPGRPTDLLARLPRRLGYNLGPKPMVPAEPGRATTGDQARIREAGGGGVNVSDAIAVEGLTKSYGRTRGVIDLTFSVAPGEVFGYLGPNGAGKTTTIRTLLDLIRPTAGIATVFGLDSRHDSIEIHRRTGYLPGEGTLYDRLTGGEYLRYLAELRGGIDWSVVVGLAERLDCDLSVRIRALSHGNRQKVSLIQAFMHRPELLVLDEPTQGLDPLVQQEFHRMVEEVRREGRTVFLSSHVMPEVERLCDRVAIIREGRLVAVEDIGDLRAREVRMLDIHFARPPTRDLFDGLPGVREVAVNGDTVRVKATGSIDAIVKAAARFEVVDLKSHEPSLEDIFLTYYGKEEDGGA